MAVASELKVPGLEICQPSGSSSGHLVIRDPSTNTILYDISSGAILQPDGTVAAPGVSFEADPDTGLYRVGANEVGVSVGGAQVADFQATSVRFPADTGGLIFANFNYVAASVSQAFFVASRPLQVVAINVRPTVAGTDGSAVTLTLNKAADGTAVGSGTALHTGTANLKGTVNTKQALALAATLATLQLAAGDSLAAVFAGTLTSAVGVVTVAMIPI